MQRLETIEITVWDDDWEHRVWAEKTLVGEEARAWLRDNYGAVDDPRIEQDRARELAIVLMAARDNQVDRACQKPDCEQCQVFERGFTWLLGTLPAKFQRAIREYDFLTRGALSGMRREAN